MGTPRAELPVFRTGKMNVSKKPKRMNSSRIPHVSLSQERNLERIAPRERLGYKKPHRSLNRGTIFAISGF